MSSLEEDEEDEEEDQEDKDDGDDAAGDGGKDNNADDRLALGSSSKTVVVALLDEAALEIVALLLLAWDLDGLLPALVPSCPVTLAEALFLRFATAVGSAFRKTSSCCSRYPGHSTPYLTHL